MKCEKAKLLINAHIDGELGEDLTIRVRDHLDGCDSCRREAVEVAAVVDRLRSVKRPAPAHLLSRVASDLQKSPTHTKVTNMKTKLSIAIGVAACAAVAALALRPTPAFADVNKIADNLQERDYVVITTDYSKEGPVPVHTAYRSGSKVRIEPQNGNVLLYTDGNVYVVETHPIAIQMVDENGNPIEGHFSFEWRVELSSLEDLDFDGNQDLSNLSKGVRIGETVLSGKTVELIEFKNNDGSRAVLWLDKEFEVPMRAEKQRLVNGKWTTVRRLDFDFSKKLDPSLFRWKQEPKAGK